MNENQNNNQPNLNPNPNMSSIGNMPQNVAALLAYLSSVFLGFIPGLYFVSFVGPLIFYIMEKNNMFVKRHAAQAVILGVIQSIISIVYLFIGRSLLNLVSFNPIGGLNQFAGGYYIVSLLMGIFSITLTVFAIIAMINAYKNKDYNIPVIGNIAKSIFK